MQISDGFPYYISLTEGEGINSLFGSIENISVLEAISEDKASFSYQEGKWSIKQILGHITDHERIMTYRALRFSRNDKTILPGYEQDIFVNNSRFNQVDFLMLIEDFKAVRAATKTFVTILSPDQLKLKGTAWKYEISVEETLRATIGHEMHHMKVIKEKYLNI
ncbi:MAG: DinB family protein [Opitutaceae bacterium]|nr:DinB family protein [Cytophagales bacterium]